MSSITLFNLKVIDYNDDYKKRIKAHLNGLDPVELILIGKFLFGRNGPEGWLLGEQ
ncbi:hypothetical protein [Salinimicrobium sp. TH3]|uniref:hypothetical protein n=1 Tax=Salinimicrobium sp. TH3 TaxID=2997342 RepID=UPI0022732636|nr:hypothetical protein [Salinimicrobium sp. TH3]MCY2686997.1 hypothetical protein [Salinimicrobium sp. TH3]